MRDYTENELCETVFYLARYAECLEIDKSITVTDERELFWMILEWAQEFERNFDPSGEKDHMIELETQGPQWLRETFPYMPEEDVARKAIIDFVNFESATSVVWPWAVPAEEIIQSEKILRKVERAAGFEQEGNFETDVLYAALDRIAGVNPVLREEPGPSPETFQPSM